MIIDHSTGAVLQCPTVMGLGVWSWSGPEGADAADVVSGTWTARLRGVTWTAVARAVAWTARARGVTWTAEER